ncbi:hypothetical protein OG275_00125 [Streptomyces niveus]|uniref:hypothetical protein n=1 Tax=Streptomyces niveus TaxID=193462 RepID=UPI002E302B7F|nr:hypothetical protein [Streptomyces niveus]
MIVRLVGGPLAGRVLETTDTPWFGDWFMVGDTAGLYVPFHRDPMTGVVLAEIRGTIPRSW